MSMSVKWKSISPTEAIQHPLYGVKNWLAVFAFGILLGLLKEVGGLNGEAQKAGLTLGQLFALDLPFVTFVKVALAVETASVAVIYWLLIAKHPKFRSVTTWIMLCTYPIVSVVGIVSQLDGLAHEVVMGGFTWAISCAVWITYLQRSERVRVTFEHCIRVIDVQIPSQSFETGHTNARSAEGSAPEPLRPPMLTSNMPTNPSQSIVNQVTAQAANTSVTPLPPVNAILLSQPMNLNESTEEDHWATALQEVETGLRRPGVWAKAFAECDGDETKSKVAYLKARVQQLMDAEKTSQEQFARQESERRRLEAVEAELVEQLRRRNAGLADPELVSAVWNGNLSTARRLLDSGMSPFGSDDSGTSILDLAKKRGDQQMVALLKDHAVGVAEHEKTVPEMTEQLVADTIAKFQSGTPPTVDEIIFLTEAAIKNPSIAKISDRLHNNTLLHWCARLNLERAATVLLQLDANAGAFNGAGQQAHQLSNNVALATTLTAAANGVAAD